MKKVLALALAVVMICTMAMALTVGQGPYTEPTNQGAYTNVNPGTIIVVEKADLDAWGLALADDTYAPEIKDAEDKVIAKNQLSVTFAKGGDLVASQGWVKVSATEWEYQIALKENDAAELDEKVDLAFDKVSLKATGVIKAQVATLDGKKVAGTQDLAPGHFDKVQFDVGYEVVEMPLNEDNEVVLANPEATLFEDHERGVIAKIVKGEGTATNGKVVLGDGVWFSAEVPVKLGQKVFLANPAVNKPTFTAKELGTAVVTPDIDGMNPIALSAPVKVGAYTLTEWTSDMNVYAKNFRTGKIVKLNETVEDGVVSFTAPAFSYIVSVDGTIAGAASAATEEVTNPGTGANDVVGVAAALAVVALVSGAAISLKK